MNTLRMKQTVAAGLIGLTAFGAAAVVPSIADAQEAPSEEAPPEAAREARHAQRAERRAERLAVVTDALGVDADALQAAREAGQSIADVAAAQGVAVQEVIDAIVDAGTTQIQEHVDAGDVTQEQADERIAGLEERVTERVNAEPGERGGHHGHHGRRGPRRGNVEEAPAA